MTDQHDNVKLHVLRFVRAQREGGSSLKHESDRFTLIELLVVIAVIAILAGMLLPALSQAKGTARRVTCASRIKGLALISQNYVASYDNYIFPAYYNSTAADYISRWYQRCMQENNPKEFEEINLSKFYMKNAPWVSQYLCPEAVFESKESVNFLYVASYAFSNIPFAAVSCPYTSDKGAYFMPISKIRKPSVRCQMSDYGQIAQMPYISPNYLNVPSAFYMTVPSTAYFPGAIGVAIGMGLRNAPTDIPDGYRSDYFKGRHNTSCNMLFFDGHVENHAGKELAWMLYHVTDTTPGNRPKQLHPAFVGPQYDN